MSSKDRLVIESVVSGGGGLGKHLVAETLVAVVSANNAAPPSSTDAPPANGFINRDLCAACKLGGTLLLCDRCPRSYHEGCAEVLTERLKTMNGEDQGGSHKKRRKKLKKLGVDQETDGNGEADSSGEHRTRVGGEDQEWICPKCLDPKHRETIAKPGRTFNLSVILDQQQSLGKGVPLGRLMQHLELMVDSLDVFHEAVQLTTTHLRGIVKEAAKSTTISLQITLLLCKLAELVGRDLLMSAIKACEDGGVIAFSLGTMGGDQPCFNPNCQAYDRFRVLRTHCLFCGSLAINRKTRLPIMGLDRFRDEFGAIRPKLWSGSTLEEERIIVASRGLDYFFEVATEARMLERGRCGDVLFLSYKLWGALRDTVLEDQARKVTEHLCNSFVDSLKGGHDVLTEDSDIAEILDTSEALHVLTRILTRTKMDPKQPKLKMKHSAVQSMIDTLLESVEHSLLEYDLTDVTGFDPRLSKSPQTPHNHCSNCGEEYQKGSRLLVCDKCKHTLSTKFDHGSMTDTVVWTFVFQSMNSDITCHSRGGKRGTLQLKDILKFLPEARKYRDLDELGEDFWKLQCYFVTHFVYVMSDWGEKELRRELYLEEFRFLTSSLNHAINANDPELVGEFLHCLCILGYRMDEDGETNRAINGLKGSFEHALRFLIASEESYGRCGMWTLKKSVAYARYHAAWCGVVGLMPQHRIAEQPAVAFTGHLGEAESRFA